MKAAPVRSVFTEERPMTAWLPRRALVLATPVMLVAAFGVARTTAGPQQYPVPTPAPGIARVTGTVDIGNRPTVDVGNRPTVDAAQKGPWTVSLDRGAPVRTEPAMPPFLHPGRYAFTWPSGTRTVYVVSADVRGGWISATPETPAGSAPLWINPAMATCIEALR
jgi:hypothetical protein